MATAKQDRTPARTASDIERKYNFGKSFGEVFGLVDEARRIAEEAEEAVKNLDTDLDQEEIFNRLTNNGEVQGIYRDENGDIYINGKYVEFIGATIGGWEITDGALKKDVTASDGTIYRVFLQPTLESYPSNTWILSCQQSTDRIHFYGTFVLYSDGSAKFGNTKISADGTITVSDGNLVLYPDGSARFGSIFLNSNGNFHIETPEAGTVGIYMGSGSGQLSVDSNGAVNLIVDKAVITGGVDGSFYSSSGQLVRVQGGLITEIS